MITEEMVLNGLSDFEFLFLTVYGEGRGEPIEGQIAIANTIKNRVENGLTYKQVCLQPLQFSCWNINDPNRPLLIELGRTMMSGPTDADMHLRQCIAVARAVKDDEFMDNSHGAKNYMTTDLFLSNKKPSWAKKPKHVLTIGNHSFLTL